MNFYFLYKTRWVDINYFDHNKSDAIVPIRSTRIDGMTKFKITVVDRTIRYDLSV